MILKIYIFKQNSGMYYYSPDLKNINFSSLCNDGTYFTSRLFDLNTVEPHCAYDKYKCTSLPSNI